MKIRYLFLPTIALAFVLMGFSLQIHPSFSKNDGEGDTLRFPEESHFKNVRQLTFGGDNAEAYWSFDSKQLVFQSNNKAWGLSCDQIFTVGSNDPLLNNKKANLVSTGRGRTTCSYFMPGNQMVLYASTHEGSPDCPKEPERRADGKYLWAIYPDFDIYIADLKGNILKKLTDSPGYDAEATISPDGKKIVFTSTRSGDLELWTMNIDGSNLRQVTKDLGYDGGAFFSPDSKRLVFRASRPKTETEIAEYKDLLKQGLVAPTSMELFTCNVDGSEMKQITHLGKANWAPFFILQEKK
jgi:Tol biopolymer transport system component